MTVWIIEPRDPLIVRDGRPFGPDPGARAATLPFPFPSTVAGGLRGLAGRTAAQSFNTALKDAVLQHVAVRGPFLVELHDTREPTWFVPAPADASVHQTTPYDEARATVVRFVPAHLPNGAAVDTPDSLLAQSGTVDKHKAHPLAPQFWLWSHVAQWLLNIMPDGAALLTEGIRALETSTRMHVKINAATQTAEEGFLYQTRGLEFATKQRKRLALAAQVEMTGDDERLFAHFSGGMAPLGGERRLMRWEQHAVLQLPPAPEDIFAQIGAQRACRIVLLTPAYFEGFAPDLAPRAAGLHPTLVAAAVPRAQVVSGWDMLHKNANGTLGAPKPTRRLAPAGSVYFVRFADGDDAQQITEWATRLWMRCIGDDEQSCRDGFGLVALGVWDGQIQQIGA